MPNEVIIITYYWPPSGGSAVQRWLDFANLLAERGYVITVVTVDEAHANYPSIDETLVNKVSPKVEVIKTKTSEVFWIYKKFVGKGKAPAAGFANEGKPGFLQLVSRFVRGNFFLPDPRKSWNKYAIEAVKKLLSNKRDVTISMGYDAALFEDVKDIQSPRDEFILTYTGTIDDSYHPEVLFKALRNLTLQNSNIKYKLRFVGILAEGLKRQIAYYGLDKILEVTGYVSHKKSVEYLMNSTAVILVSPQVRTEEIIIPGKLYEYLATRKPIINIGSLKCDTARIVSLCEAGKNFDRTMETELTSWLQQLTEAWLQNPDTTLTNSNTTSKNYSRNQEVGQLIKLIG
ncbi:MAG: glycosyltransferase [Bacteroidetes bacterium]|nr:glycosyltransferase [Bacteroidota bacterium]